MSSKNLMLVSIAAVAALLAGCAPPKLPLLPGMTEAEERPAPPPAQTPPQDRIVILMPGAPASGVSTSPMSPTTTSAASSPSTTRTTAAAGATPPSTTTVNVNVYVRRFSAPVRRLRDGFRLPTREDLERARAEVIGR